MAAMSKEGPEWVSKRGIDQAREELRNDQRRKAQRGREWVIDREKQET